MALKKISQRNLGGRPTKCTPEIVDEFCKYLAMNVHIDICAAVCGLAPRTVQYWLKRGRNELDRLIESGKDHLKVRPSEECYIGFLQRVTQLLAKNEAMLVGKATQRSPEWMLTHRYRERWGSTNTEVDVVATIFDGENNAEVDDFEKDSDKSLNQLIFEHLNPKANRVPAAGTQEDDSEGIDEGGD